MRKSETELILSKLVELTSYVKMKYDEEHMQNMIKLEKLEKGRMQYREMHDALSPNLGKMI